MVPRRLVEAAIRSWWILPLPVILVPLFVFLASSPEEPFESSATVWVTPSDTTEPGSLVRIVDGELTPAENQALILNDLLATLAFRESVALSVWPEAAPAVGERLVKQDVSVFASGANLITVQATADDGAIAQALVAGVIAQFETEIQEAATAEADRQLASILTERIQALDEFNARHRELFDYIDANPSALVVSAPLGTTIEEDPAYARLLVRYEEQSTRVDVLYRQYEEAQLAATAIQADQQAAFVVQDEPDLPLTPTPATIVERLTLPAAGGALGLAIAAGYLAMAAYGSRRIESAEDLVPLDVQLLGEVPEMRGRLVSNEERLLPSAPWTGRTKHYARRVAIALSAEAEGGR